jgi:Flp pilus assembly protein TadD
MSRHRPELLVCLFLIIITLAAYWQVQHHGFINLDDDLYVTENQKILAGLTKDSIRWAFFSNDTNYWHPLTWLSHMVDSQIYGSTPSGHHFNSLLLHLANTLLLFLILKGMTGALWQSAAVAVLFAVHPLNVESVAWVANRKTVLSTFFWMLTILSYAYYVKSPSLPRYSIVFLSLALGLMAKPILVTLPFVLLLLDYWPLGRFHVGQVGPIPPPMPKGSENQTYQRAALTRLLLEKAPLFLLSLFSTALSFLSSKSLGLVISTDRVPYWLRMKNAVVSYISYIGKMIWPKHLAVFYPYPDMVPLWKFAGAALLLSAMSILVFRASRRAPFLFVGWFWYVGTLVPVIGFVQQGLWPALADRFTYVPLIGLFIMIVWGASWIVTERRLPKILIPVSAGIVCLLLGIRTWSQAQYWKNSIVLFEHAIQVTTQNHLAHHNLGAALRERGNLQDAVSHYLEALRIMPNNAEFHTSLAAALVDQGHVDEAAIHLSKALRDVPTYAEAHVVMGIVLWRQGNAEEAIAHYHKALDIKPLAEAHHNLALTLAEQGKPEEAVIHYYKALEIKPLAETHHNLALTLAAHGDLEEAIRHYRQALRIKPDDASAHNDLGVALSFQGRVQEGVYHFREALRVNPEYLEARHNLSLVLERTQKSGP